jgi:hypothetical protein
MPLASPGKKLNIVASDWNDMQAMLREWRHGRLSFGGSGVSNPLGSTVWVKNISANDVTPGDVLGLGNPVITPTDDVTEFRARLAFEGSIPSTSTPHYDQYGIVQEACAKTDGFCRCVVSGITFCKLNITHAADLYCEIANSKHDPLWKDRLIFLIRIILSRPWPWRKCAGCWGCRCLCWLWWGRWRCLCRCLESMTARRAARPRPRMPLPQSRLAALPIEHA